MCSLWLAQLDVYPCMFSEQVRVNIAVSAPNHQPPPQNPPLAPFNGLANNPQEMIGLRHHSGFCAVTGPFGSLVCCQYGGLAGAVPKHDISGPF